MESSESDNSKSERIGRTFMCPGDGKDPPHSWLDLAAPTMGNLPSERLCPAHQLSIVPELNSKNMQTLMSFIHNMFKGRRRR